MSCLAKITPGNGVKDVKNELSIKIPLITEEEIRYIDNNIETIVNTFTKQIIRDKDLAIAQQVVRRLQEENKILKNKEKFYNKLAEDNKYYAEEIEKKDKIIDEMARELINQFSHYEPCCLEFETECKKYKTCEDCIIQYFERKVSGADE